MARFQAGEVTGEASSTLPGRAGPSVAAKKPAEASLLVKRIPPKPTLKNSDAGEANKSKALVSKLPSASLSSSDRPEYAQKTPPKPSAPQPAEAKAPAAKPSASKPPLSATLSDPKAAFSKPSPPVQQKPTSSICRLRQQTVTPSKPSLPNAAPKPPSNFKEAQSVFAKEAGGPEQVEGSGKAPPPAASSTPPPTPAASKKPSLKRPSAQTSSSNRDAAATGPKRNHLLNIFALGPAPAKPNRPPAVNLEPFRRGEESSNGESGRHFGGAALRIFF